MPATAGRCRMPHNNRVSTSGALATSEIWKNTIGHDPHAGLNEIDGQDSEAQAENERRTKGLMELARFQSIANGTSSAGKDDSFSQKMFTGLKQRKKISRLENHKNGMSSGFGNGEACDISESSSEEEFIEVQVEEDDDEEGSETKEKDRNDVARKKETTRRKKKRKKERKKRDESSSSDNDSRYERDRRRRKKRRRHHHHRRHRSKQDYRDEGSSDESGTERKRRSRDSGERKRKERVRSRSPTKG